MKITIAILLAFALHGCGAKENVTKAPVNQPDSAVSTCIDSARIRKDAICPMNWLPVCGCNKVTFGNACMAESAGVLRWTEGECPETKP